MQAIENLIFSMKLWKNSEMVNDRLMVRLLVFQTINGETDY